MPKVTDDGRELVGMSDQQLTEAHLAGFITHEQWLGSVKMNQEAAEVLLKLLQMERSSSDWYHEMFEQLIFSVETIQRIAETLAAHSNI
jgi:hypothetical protein